MAKKKDDDEIDLPQTVREISEDERKELMQRVSKTRTKLLAAVPFFGHLCLNLRPREARPGDGVMTAGVARDGTLILNYDFAKSLTDKQFCGLLCHEVLHPALFCFDRQGSRRAMVMGPGGQTFSLWNLCHPAGTYVTGFGNIEEIAAGNSVVTASGIDAASQIKQHLYKGDMFKISALGLIPFEATSEHPVLVAKRNGSNYPIKLGEPEWIPACDVRARDHYLVVPRAKAESSTSNYNLDSYTESGRWGANDLAHNRKLRGGLPLTEGVAWSMGFYTANGCVSDGVRWTLNIKAVAIRERLIQTWFNLGFKVSINPRADVNAIDITVTSSILARLFAKMFGRKAHEKRIDDSILFHDNLFILGEYLKGYIDGDGNRGAAVTATTVSDDLIRQLQLAYARMGVLGKVYRTKQHERVLGGYTLPAGEIWTLSMNRGVTTPRIMNGNNIQCSTQRWKLAEDFILTPVKDVTRRDADEMVYNFATPDHSYAVNNALVHNCHDMSFNPEILELANKSQSNGDIELPPMAAMDEKYKGHAAEEIYDKLLQLAIKNAQNHKGDKGGCFGVFTEFPGGGHSIGDDMRDDLSETAEGQRAARGDKAASEALAAEWKVNVVAAATVQEREKGKGTLPAGLQKIVDEILDPRLDWKDVLSRWIGENGRRQDYTYRRPARRSESVGEYLPSAQRFGVDDIIVLWDTSGSMNGREGEILGDVEAICEDLGLSLRILMCDADV
ncbi:MAG: hypothetical protein MN733_02925, partial [Nitrososphaera sp.]|nr:hypothetical protein [Nitrososphaera sp.]